MFNPLKSIYNSVKRGLSSAFTNEIVIHNPKEQKKSYPSDIQGLETAFIQQPKGPIDPVTIKKTESLPKRLNNPGALEYAGQHGARANGRFAEFTDYNAGRKALEKDLYAKFTGKSKTSLTPDSTIEDFVKVYAPKTENDVSYYTNMLTSKLGKKPTDKIGGLVLEIPKFADVIEVAEGYRTPAELKQKQITERQQMRAEQKEQLRVALENDDGPFWNGVKNFFSVDTTKQTIDTAVIPALQSIPRSVLTVALSTVGKGILDENERFIDPIEDFGGEGNLASKLLGREKIKPITNTGTDFLASMGAGEESSRKYGGIVGLGLVAADLFPSLKSAKSLKLLAAEKDAVITLKILKAESGLADDILIPVAEAVAKADNVADVEKILAENSVKLVGSGKVAEMGLAQRGTTLKESFEAGIESALRKEAGVLDPNIIPTTSKPLGFFGKLKASLNPLKSTDTTTQKIFSDWHAKLAMGKQLADESVAALPTVSKEGLETILKYESGKFTPVGEALKSTFDNLYKEASERGVQLPYRQNYLPQVYNNTREEVMEATAKLLKDKGVDEATIKGYLSGVAELPTAVSQRLGVTPFFQEERVFQTYAEAMKYGLKPKYTNPVQLVAHYRNQLEKTIANRELLDNLVKEGKIMVSELAPRDWKAVEFPFSPKGYFAEPKVANMINGIFRDEEALGFGETLAKYTAQVSKKAQEVALSAGVPATTVNFFAIGQVVKELTAGNFKAIIPYVRANFNKRSIAFFRDNIDVMKRMAQEGLDLGSTVASYDKAFDSFKNQPTLWKKMGFAFDKAFNEKTFGSLMPQLHIQTFKDAEAKFIAKGLEAGAARKLAAEVTQNAFGLMKFAGRSKLTDDVLSSVFFAPRFREGVIKTLFNTARSMTTELGNPAFYKNRKLMGGMVLSYGMYNGLNYKLNGHFMWDNEPGKEFDLRIPLPNGDVAYLGFMPGFLAFARNMVSGGIATTKGDFDTATQKFGSLFSIPLKLTSEIYANKDYFGREIYDPEEAGFDKLKSIGGYAGLQVNHPFIRELGKQLFTDKPAYQSISEGMELPFKFKTQTQLETAQYYDAIDKQKDMRKDAQKKIRPIYTQVQELKEAGLDQEAQKIIDALSDEDWEVYSDIKQAEKTKATKALKVKIYPIYERVQELKAEGKDEEVKSIVDSLSEEEWRVYKLIKEQGL